MNFGVGVGDFAWPTPIPIPIETPIPTAIPTPIPAINMKMIYFTAP
jgi:hypothetical protein